MNLSSAPGSLFLSGCLKHKGAGSEDGFTVLYMVNWHLRIHRGKGKGILLGQFLKNGRSNELLHVTTVNKLWTGNFFPKRFSWAHVQSARERSRLSLRKGGMCICLYAAPKHCWSSRVKSLIRKNQLLFPGWQHFIPMLEWYQCRYFFWQLR